MMSKCVQSLLLLFLYGFLPIQSQILRRQFIGDAQQLQVPIRRINVPYNLRTGQRSDQRPDLKETPINRECPKCLEKRLIQHYMARGCTPVIKGGCDCPSRYECPSSAQLVDESNVCTYGGKSYRIGDTIHTQNPCRICECRYVGLEVKIDCSVQIECPALTSKLRPNDQCYAYYSHNKCCARDECPTSGRRNKVCVYRGKQYRIGEKIATDGNKCMSCICTEEWDDNNPLNHYSCRKVECELSLNDKFSIGCTPIYHEDVCCPIDYTCPKKNRLRVTGLESRSYMCEFEGRKYAVGSNLYIENKCVNCVCEIPPQFTCIQKKKCQN